MGVDIGGGKLKWAAELDNSKLKTDAQQATKILDDMGNEITRKDVFKEMIRQQKELIKSIETDIASLQKSYDKLSAGAAKNGPGGIGADIVSAKRALAEEQAELVKLQEQSQHANDKEGESVSGLTDKIKNWAIGLFSVSAALKLVEGIIHSSNTVTLEFQAVIAGAKAGIEYFFKSIASGDWSGFRQGLDRAIQAGYEYTKVMNQIANESNELAIKQSEDEIKIGELREKTYSKDSSNNFERRNALIEMIDLEKNIYAQKSELDRKALESTIELSAAKNKLSTDEIKNLLHEYTSLEAVLKLGEQYNLKLALLSNAQKTPGLESRAVELQKEIALMGESARVAGDYATRIGNFTQAERDQITALWTKANADEGEFFSKTRRYGTQLAEVNNQIMTGWYSEIENANQKAEDLGQKQSDFQSDLNQKRIDNALSIREQMISIQEDGADKELQLAQLAFDKRMAELEKEKQATIKKINETSGYINDSGERVHKDIAVLPQAEQNQFDDQVAAATATRDTKLVEIHKKAQENLKHIDEEISKDFADETEKRIIEINKEYDARIKKAKENLATEDDLTRIEEARAKAIAEAHQETSIKMTEYYKKAFGDIEILGYASLKKLVEDTDKIMATARTQTQGGKTMVMVDVDELDKEGNAIKKTFSMTIEEFKQLQDKYTQFQKQIRDKNPFKALSDSFKDIEKAIKNNDKEALGDAFEKFDSAADKAIKYAEELGSALGDLFGNEVSKDIKVITDLATGAKDLGKGFGQLVSGDVVGGVMNIVKGAAKIIKTLTEGNKQYQKDVIEFYAKMIEMAAKYKNALIDLIQAQKGVNDSVFINDYANTIKQASIAIDKAEKEFNRIALAPGHREGASTLTSQIISSNDQASLEKYLNNLDVQIGVTRKKFLGITTGSKPVFGSLLKEYPALIDANGKFNDTVAETILQMEGLPDATKAGLQALVDYEKQVEESQAAIDSAIQSMAGFISDNLMSALMDAWDNGTDAFQAFKDTVTSGLKDIVSQMIFNAVFAKAFRQLQTDMETSFGVVGDQSITDDLTRFYEQAPELVRQWLDGMTQAQQEAMANGMDWQKTQAQDSSGTLTGAIQQDITEQTASIIAGQFNAMQVNVIEQLRVFRESVTYQKQIAENTLRAADILQLINSRVTQEESLRASGL